VKEEHWTGELAHWCDGRRPSAPARYMSWPEPATNSIWVKCSKQVSIALSYLRSALVRCFNRARPG
jgi:hypothetical protein